MCLVLDNDTILHLRFFSKFAIKIDDTTLYITMRYLCCKRGNKNKWLCLVYGITYVSSWNHIQCVSLVLFLSSYIRKVSDNYSMNIFNLSIRIIALFIYFRYQNISCIIWSNKEKINWIENLKMGISKDMVRYLKHGILKFQTESYF